ncbi:hypothetical protein V7128_16915 [Neobacillus vireti]|uniref:hypothetical protein n=1 Tax=Neobacillus vireti TaxID=220686 RepID=UPI002FFEA8E8
MIYSDRYGAISKLINDENYELIAGVWKEGRLIAALFNKASRGGNNEHRLC